jgi:mitogen-activated protein kinase kinase
MAALLRSQAMRQQGGGPGAPGSGPGESSGGGGPRLPGPASGPLSSLAARRAGNRPNLGAMGMGASTPAMGGLAGRRGPPGGLNLSDMKGAAKDEGNKFTDYSKIMYVVVTYYSNLTM